MLDLYPEAIAPKNPVLIFEFTLRLEELKEDLDFISYNEPYYSNLF